MFQNKNKKKYFQITKADNKMNSMNRVKHLKKGSNMILMMIILGASLASLILAIMLLTMWKRRDVKQMSDILKAIAVFQVISIIALVAYTYKLQIGLCSLQSIPTWIGILLRIVILLSSVKLIQTFRDCNDKSNKIHEMFEEEYKFWRDVVAWTIIAPAMFGFMVLVLGAIGAYATITEERHKQNTRRIK